MLMVALREHGYGFNPNRFIGIIGRYSHRDVLGLVRRDRIFATLTGLATPTTATQLSCFNRSAVLRLGHQSLTRLWGGVRITGVNVTTANLIISITEITSDLCFHSK